MHLKGSLCVRRFKQNRSVFQINILESVRLRETMGHLSSEESGLVDEGAVRLGEEFSRTRTKQSGTGGCFYRV